MAEIKRIFMVDGKPFYPMGGRARTSSGYNEKESEQAFRGIKTLHGNTLSIPVYWNKIEPEEGEFDFTSVDKLFTSARRHGIKLSLSWFATWFDGAIDYAPAWIKTNPQRFKRAMSPTGNILWTLSPHCRESLKADKKAFTALCKHLKAEDKAEQIVISIQVEDEPGIVGSDRDYSPEGQAAFNSPVPDKLLRAMQAAGKGSVYDLWQKAGGKKSGTWPEIFGRAAGELMTAWSFATYMDSVAEAGKAIYDVPMFISTWLSRNWAIPGESYPSGGPVAKVLDIYKWFTPHVDMIVPDIYINDSKSHEAVLAAYTRDDNPLFIAETAITGPTVWNMFRAIADYNAIGYNIFSPEYVVTDDGSVHPDFKSVVDSFRCLAATIPLLLKYQGTGKIHAVIQEEGMELQPLNLDGYLGLVQFGEGPLTKFRKDWRHYTSRMLSNYIPQAESNRGRGLVVQVSKNEFYLVGANYRLLLRPDLPPDKMRVSSFISDFLLLRDFRHLSVDEGHFDQNGEFVIDRQRNGTEINYGLWVEPDTGVLRVITCDY
jgi:beta-galactosidase GanA